MYGLPELSSLFLSEFKGFVALYQVEFIGDPSQKWIADPKGCIHKE
jgi:hypothetical protein